MSQLSVDTYIIDSLLPDLAGHDRRLAAYAVYLFLYRHAAEQSQWSVRMSHQSIANATGLSRSAVQAALGHLQKRQLIATSRSHSTSVPLHRVQRPWLRWSRPKN